MALPTTSPTSWMQSLDLPSQVFGTGSEEFELYEEDGEFVLSVEMPGYEKSDIDLTWHDGRLNIAAEREDETRGRKRTYHQTFRFPKDVEEDAIDATYENGVLEVALPIAGTETRGKTIEL